jgi:hypothetical protein
MSYLKGLDMTAQNYESQHAPVAVIKLRVYIPRTRKLSIMELVSHKRLERKSKRIDIAQPFEPWVHIWQRNRVPGIYHNGENQDGCNSQSLRDGFCGRCYCSEHRRHSKPDQNGK